MQHQPADPTFRRRAALKLLGGFGTFAAFAGFARGASGSDLPACAAALEGEIGPYFADDAAAGFARSNILANLDGSEPQAGVPLTLHVYAYEAKHGCRAYVGAQVDIWHCNAYGVYSDEAVENTTGQTWLRGYQITDANGLVTFRTILPGWYEGRTTHIHLKVRSSYDEGGAGDENNTTQLFFPQTTLAHLSTSVAPYSSRGVDGTTNKSDHVFADETKGANVLSLAGGYAHGFAATFAVHLPIVTA